MDGGRGVSILRQPGTVRAAIILAAVAIVAGCGSTTTGASSAGSASAPASTPSATLSRSDDATATPSQVSVAPSPTPVPLEGRIVFARRNAADDFVVFVIGADGTGERRLVDGAHEIPRWSPDGSHVSMTTDVDGLIRTAIVATDGSGYEVLPIPAPGLSLGCSAWSPDGTHLACEGWDDNDPKRNGIYTIRASDGGDLVRVTSSPNGGHDLPGSYSPDGKQLSAVRSTEADHGAVYLVAVDGGSMRAVDAGDTFSSAFAPDGLSILVDGPPTSLSLIGATGGAV